MGRRPRARRAYATVQDWQDATNTTQKKLADLLGISDSHLCNVLRGNRNPTLKLALRIADLTNVPIENIGGRTPKFVNAER